MPFIQYEFTDPSAPGFKSAMSICADSMLVKDNPEFMAFVKEQGFDAPTISKDGKTTTYTSESLQLQIEVTIQPKGAVITTTIAPRSASPTRPSTSCLWPSSSSSSAAVSWVS